MVVDKGSAYTYSRETVANALALAQSDPIDGLTMNMGVFGVMSDRPQAPFYPL